MKKLLVFTELPKAYAPTRLMEEAKKAGISSQTICYADIDFVLDSKSGISISVKSADIPTADAIVFRSPGKGGEFAPKLGYLRERYEKQGAKILNNKTYSKWLYNDKFMQHFVFQKIGVPYVKSHFLGDARVLKEKKIFEYPFIAKHFIGSHGSGVHKISNDQDLERLFEIHPNNSLIIQPFLSSGEDVRVIVLGGRAIGAMKRVAPKNGYLTNYSAGGSIENFDLNKNPEVRRLAKITSRAFDCDYAGVDIMKNDNGDWVVLEVNRACQFEGFEKVTGINVASELISYLDSKK